MEASTTPFLVLNPGGRDPDQDFPDFAGPPDSRIHAPVNFHGYAACTGGAFLKSTASVRARQGKIVILLLRGDLRESLKALRELKRAGIAVLISFKETGLHQIAQTLQKKGNAALFNLLCAEADAALAATEDSLAVYRSGGARSVHFIPTPYPVDDPRWDFSIPAEERRGILVGTREFDVPSRHHLPAVLAALHLSVVHGESVTVVNLDGRSGRAQLASLAGAVPAAKLEIVEGRRNYPDYLRLLARHKLVFQLDASAVPGQVAGDALLCRVPCVGGNGATERLVFPHLCGHGRDLPAVTELAGKLLNDVAFYAESMRKAETLAVEKLSFTAVREQLGALHC